MDGTLENRIGLRAEGAKGQPESLRQKDKGFHFPNEG